MLLDLTLPITPAMQKEAKTQQNPALEGHLGTHFDAMDKCFPLEYTRLQGVVFDVSSVGDGEIGAECIDMDKISRGMFVAFYTGFGEKVGYGNPGYFSAHPTLSLELIDLLLQKGVSVIGVDFAGIRRGKEHIPIEYWEGSSFSGRSCGRSPHRNAFLRSESLLSRDHREENHL